MNTEIKLTKKQKWMLAYVKGANGEYISPTEVGRAYGIHVLGSLEARSSIASPTLLKLTKFGFLKRNNQGHYAYNRK